MTDYTVSSGNIFKDLGFPNPDEELAKVKLASKINRLIEEKGLTQKEAAQFLELSKYKMATLRNGRLNGFTIDRLFSLLGKLDHHVEIQVSPKSIANTTENIHVAVI